MKTKAEIKTEQQRLRELIDNDATNEAVRRFAYAMETALQWVLEDCDWDCVACAAGYHDWSVRTPS